MKVHYAFITACILALVAPSFGRDSDKDGIPNKYDECKDQPEDFDKFEDRDGCPDFDNDKDGILDVKDKCPNDAEDMDGFEDTDGCPDKDNDKDGIPDKMDKCPNQQEDMDGFKDTDGCPDEDNDSDGILDINDKCPLDKEDIDGFEDDNGCPDYDNDKDGIKDDEDKCPNKPENHNDKDDEDGCPDSDIAEIKPFQALPEVKFKAGTSELIFEAQETLNFLAKQLSAFPDKRIKLNLFMPFIQSPEFSLQLLQERHEMLINYLIEKGASSSQFTPREYNLENYSEVKETESDFNQNQPLEVELVIP